MRASTFSIVACDLERRQWGVAVASRFLAIGALSAWAEPEVGAVATQSWIKAAHGANGLRLLADGGSAAQAVERLLAGDDGREQRQLGIIDGQGRTAAYTGEACLDWAGERTGASYSAQGNMLASEQTLAELANAFESAPGSLAERLISALSAAQAAGGDRRGKQSAALRVVGRGQGYGGADVVCDLRVDDHADPAAELERLFGLHRLYFGSTPREEWLEVDDGLEAELRRRLERLGYASGDLAGDLETWAGVENLEERVRGADRVDPVVLAELRGQDEREGRVGDRA